MLREECHDWVLRVTVFACFPFRTSRRKPWSPDVHSEVFTPFADDHADYHVLRHKNQRIMVLAVKLAHESSCAEGRAQQTGAKESRGAAKEAGGEGG